MPDVIPERTPMRENVALRNKIDFPAGGIKGRLGREQKYAYGVSHEERHLREPPTERRMSTLSPSSKKCSASDVTLPEFAIILVLVKGSSVSKSIGKHKEPLMASHSLKTDASPTESAPRWEIRLRDSVSLLGKKKIAPEGCRPSRIRPIATKG